MWHWRMRADQPTTRNERYFMQRILGLFCLVAVLAGCDHGERELRWKEDVLLQDGRVITLDRVAKYEGSRELTQKNYGLSWYAVDFEHPVTRERIHWESQISVSTDELVRARNEKQEFFPSMILLSVLVRNDDLYLILSPHASFESYECPDPPYILLKWEQRQWKLKKLEDIPYRKFTANVMYDLNGGRDAIKASQFHVPITVIANQTIGNGMPLVIDLTRMTKQTVNNRCSLFRSWTEHEAISN